jgi:type III pantothenate kinase
MAWVLALDRGNDSLKVALFDSGRIIGRWREGTAHPLDTLRRIATESVLAATEVSRAALGARDRGMLMRVLSNSAVFHSVVFCSVDPKWTDEIKNVFETLGVSRIVEVSSALRLPFRVLVERPRSVGPDRLAAVAGVAAAGYREGIVIDAGTAITVDVLSERGFLGGAIFPGTGLLRRTLWEGTAALPLVSDRRGRLVEPPGRTTVSAIIAGTHWGVIGAVKELIARSRRRVSSAARIWVTGGGGAAIAPHLGARARYEKDLVSLGLHHLFDLNVP